MENISRHLKNRFKLEYQNTSEDSNFRSEVRRYRKLYTDLGYNSNLKYSEGIDQIYEELMINQDANSLARYMSSSKSEGEKIEKLKKAYSQQREYYENELKKSYLDLQMRSCHRMADIDIAVHQYEGWASMAPNIKEEKTKYGWDYSLQKMINEYEEYHLYLDGILEMVYSQMPQHQDIEILKKAISIEKEYYCNVKRNYSRWKNDCNKDNPYKLLYMYLRNQYLMSYMIYDLPDIEISEIKNVNFEYPCKETYTLRDVAEVWALMTEAESIPYELIKKEFQKLSFMNSYKVNGVYEFKDLCVPLAEYCYYKKKGRFREEYLDDSGKDPIIVGRYVPAIHAILNGNKEIINQYKAVREYFTYEYNELFSSLNDQYQSGLFEFLVGGFYRIYYLNMGLDIETVYPDWDIARQGNI